MSRRPRCELCDAPAVWLALDVGAAVALCDDHRHAAAADLDPLPPPARCGPERLGAIVDRVLKRRAGGRRRPLDPER